MCSGRRTAHAPVAVSLRVDAVQPVLGLEHKLDLQSILIRVDVSGGAGHIVILGHLHCRSVALILKHSLYQTTHRILCFEAFLPIQ